MPRSSNENFAFQPPPPANEPDAHGQAALILAEAILHALVDIKTMTTAQALDVVHSAAEIKAEIATLSGESRTRMHESLELLKRIGISLKTDLN